MKIALIILVVILAVGLVLLIFLISSSEKYDEEFFGPLFIEKYNSPVDIYETYTKFLMTRKQNLWEEMIGKRLKENEKLPEIRYRGYPPSIQEYKIERDHATIVMDGGEKIEMDFVKDRWVLSQKTPSFYLRKFTRDIKYLFRNLTKKLKPEETEKIEVPTRK